MKNTRKNTLRVCIIVMHEFIYDSAILWRATNLASEGYEVRVVALKDKAGDLPSLEKKCGFSVIRVDVLCRRLLNFPPIKFFWYLEYFIRAFPLCVKMHADIYHAWNRIEALLLSFAAARVTAAKIVYETGDLNIDSMPKNTLAERINRKIFYFLEYFLIKRADVVTAGTDSVALVLRDMYGIRLPVTIRLCKPYSRVEGADKLRRLFDIAPDKKIIVYLGVMIMGRGLDKLIDAAPGIKGAVIVLIGEGDYKSALMEHVQRQGLVQKVKFLNRILPQDMALYVSSADIGVSPLAKKSHHPLQNMYNLDNRIFIYISCGLPIAVSDTVERRKLVESYGLGVVFDENNPTDIAEKINSLLQDSRFYGQCSMNAINAAKGGLSLERESKKMLDLYNKI